MPNSRYCQTKGCSSRTETDHPHCPACEALTAARVPHRRSLPRRACAATGCDQLATSGASKCYDHQINWAGWEHVEPKPVPRLKGLDAICTFDVICLQCAQRRVARGTEDDANYTRRHLGPCAVCRGPQVVERSDLGGISSPAQGHSVTYDAGRAGRKAGSQ